jgi:hypothetical protein
VLTRRMRMLCEFIADLSDSGWTSILQKHDKFTSLLSLSSDYPLSMDNR